MAVPTAGTVEAATGACAAGASGAAATIPIVVLAVFAVVVFVVHFLVVLVELAAVVNQEERWLTRWHNWRRRRRLKLPVGDQILLQLQQLAHEVEVR